MNALQELKQLLKETKRKTLPVDQIEPLIQAIDKMYIQTANKLTDERKTNAGLRDLNAKIAMRLGIKVMDKNQLDNLLKGSMKREKRTKQIR